MPPTGIKFVGIMLVAIAQEKKEVEMRSGIEHFNKENMKHADTQVKQVLPDKDSKYGY